MLKIRFCGDLDKAKLFAIGVMIYQSEIALEKFLQTVLEDTFSTYAEVIDRYPSQLRSPEIGIVQSIGQGIARVVGLPHVQSEEIVRFTGGSLGIMFNLDPEEVGVILLDSSDTLQ